MANFSDGYFSKTLEKGMKILNLFNQDRKTLSLTTISRELGINKTSVFRLTNTFIKLGYLNKQDHSRLLEIGPKAIFLSHNLIKSFDLMQIIKPSVDVIYQTYNITIHVALLVGDTMLIIYQREAEDALTFKLPTIITALHCTALGKAALSYLPEDDMKKIVDRLNLIKKTDKTITNKYDLIADLEKVRKKGYSINNEEYILGLLAIGAPLFDAEKKRVTGAIAFDFPASQYSLSIVEKKFTEILIKAAKNISDMNPIKKQEKSDEYYSIDNG